MSECKKKVYIGGQAVMEGVMMKAPDRLGIAVRRASDGGIETFTKPVEAAASKHKILGWPFVRGVVNFIESLTEGMKTITRSAEMIGDESLQEEPTKFEKWLSKVTGKDVMDIVMFVAVLLAILLAVGLFFVLPSLAGSLLNKLLPESTVLVNLLEGIVRLLIFLGYILAISRMKEIKRVFMYHGAEHKTVYCNEAGEELTPENARKHSRLHPRCGTAFLFLVMIISILIGSVADEVIYLLFGIEKLGFLARFGRSLLILPLVTGVSYEVLKGLAHAGDHIIVRALRWPGLMLQHLTTREPDDAMLEVAIASMKAAKAGADRYADELGENVFLYTGEEEEKTEDKNEEKNEEKDGAQA